jgi:hypothetical protein
MKSETTKLLEHLKAKLEPIAEAGKLILTDAPKKCVRDVAFLLTTKDEYSFLVWYHKMHNFVILEGQWPELDGKVMLPDFYPTSESVKAQFKFDSRELPEKIIGYAKWYDIEMAKIEDRIKVVKQVRKDEAVVTTKLRELFFKHGADDNGVLFYEETREMMKAVPVKKDGDAVCRISFDCSLATAARLLHTFTTEG